MINLFVDSFDSVDSFDGTEYFYDCQLNASVKYIIPDYSDEQSYNVLLSTRLPFIIVQEQNTYGDLLREIKLGITTETLGVFKLTLSES